MDVKTLGYMETRVRKATGLIKKIKLRQSIIAVIDDKKEGFADLEIFIRTKNECMAISSMGRTDLIPTGVMFSLLREPIMDALNKQIDELEKELAEI